METRFALAFSLTGLVDDVHSSNLAALFRAKQKNLLQNLLKSKNSLKFGPAPAYLCDGRGWRRGTWRMEIAIGDGGGGGEIWV